MSNRLTWYGLGLEIAETFDYLTTGLEPGERDLLIEEDEQARRAELRTDRNRPHEGEPTHARIEDLH